MLESTVLNTDYDLAEMSDLQRPNLLDNADFKSGIINQIGQEEYNLGTGNTGNKLTINRWIGNCTYVKPYDGYLYIKDNIDTAKAYLYQNLSSVCNGDYTVYINISSMSGGTLNLYFDGELSNKFTISEQGEHIYTFEGVSNQNKFDLELDGFEGNIECIKLEKGSVFTGMPQWDFALEWFKCQRYLYIVVNSSILNARYDGSNLCINFKTPMSFVNKPSIIHNNATFGVTSFNGSYENHNVSDFTVNTYDGGNINIIKPSSNPSRYGMAIVVNGFYLDAEIY